MTGHYGWSIVDLLIIMDLGSRPIWWGGPNLVNWANIGLCFGLLVFGPLMGLRAYLVMGLFIFWLWALVMDRIELRVNWSIYPWKDIVFGLMVILLLRIVWDFRWGGDSGICFFSSEFRQLQGVLSSLYQQGLRNQGRPFYRTEIRVSLLCYRFAMFASW